MLPAFRDRQAVFQWLNDYTAIRRVELDQHDIAKDQGLLKAYLLETAPNGVPTERFLIALPGETRQIDEDLYLLEEGGRRIGVVEKLYPRYWTLYTIQKTAPFEPTLTRAVRESPWVDFAWFASVVLQTVWEQQVRPNYPHRMTRLTFEYEARYEWDPQWDSLEEGEEDEEALDEFSSRDDAFPRKGWREYRAATIALSDRVRQLDRFLEKSEEYAPFLAFRSVRLPAEEHGGYDLWNWGKLTFRAPSFFQGRSHLLDLLAIYQKATKRLEELAWMHFSSERVGESTAVRWQGRPITVRFPKPLQPSVFRRFVTQVFTRPRNRFRLWGTPLWRSEQYAFVHAVDLHLWKPLDLELTPAFFRLFLPQGACGNSVHRFVQNVQHYLSPRLEVYVGEIPYVQLFGEAMQPMLDKE